MKPYKKLLSFDSLIYLTVVSFVVYHFISLYSLSLNVIYGSSNHISTIIYFFAATLLIALAIAFVYYLPIVFIVEVVYKIKIHYELNILLSHRNISKSAVNLNIILEKNNLFQKLQVIRC